MSTLMMLDVPDDEELLAAFGEMAIRHEQLNYVLRMMIKTLARLTLQEALDATTNDGSGHLRNRIRKLARQRLGEGQPLLKVQALMGRCQRVTDKRNELVHCVWAKERDGEAQLRNADHIWRPLPTRQELSELSSEIRDLTSALNKARLEGFLSEALAERAV